MKKVICLALVLALACSFLTAAFADGAEKVSATFIYVAESGDDAAAGTADAPLKTIAAAVKKAEGIDGTVVVNLKGGVYQMTDTINLTDANSNLVIRAIPGDDVLVTGGTVLPYSAFTKCTDEEFLSALVDKKNKDKIVCANLKDLGVAELGIIRRQGAAGGNGDNVGYAHTLSYNDKALTIARYPNEGYIYTENVVIDGLDPNAEGFFNGNAKKIEYTLSDKRYQKWSGKDIWAVGYFMHDWADSTAPAEFTDKNTVVGYTSSYGVKENRRVYYFNIPEELDMEGEWYLDSETGILYMIPVEGMKADDTLVYNAYNKPFFTLSGAKNVEFTGITFSGTCARGIDAENCDTLLVNDCEFTGIGDTAVHASKSYRVTVKNSYFHDLGSTGVYLSECGDRINLVSGECVIDNCHFERFSQYRKTYSPAIQIYNDVGTVISHNEIHDAPHFAIRYEANDSIIEYNDFYDVCQDTADTGAVYTGRRWETRGNELRYNYFHDMTEVATTTGMEKMGVYLDDCSSSTRVHGNVFFNIDSVALMGGGRHNEFTNNIMVNCKKPLVFDERGLTWSLDQQTNFLKQVPYKEGVWAEKYPELVNIMEDEPGCPKYNVLKNKELDAIYR